MKIYIATFTDTYVEDNVEFKGNDKKEAMGYAQFFKRKNYKFPKRVKTELRLKKGGNIK